MGKNNDMNFLKDKDIKQSKKEVKKTKKTKEKNVTDNKKLNKYSFDKLSKKEKWC